MTRLRWMIALIGAGIIAVAAIAWWVLRRGMGGATGKDLENALDAVRHRVTVADAERDVRVAVARTADAGVKASLASALAEPDAKRRGERLIELSERVGL